jgi:cyclophilin family peptidyl-prolyl cis-trans isomerase
MRVWIGALCALALVAAACGSGDDNKGGTRSDAFSTTPGASTTDTGGAEASPIVDTSSPCATVTAQAVQSQTGGSKTYTSAPPMTIDVNKTYCAIIQMDIGNITLELFAKDAPVTVNNFVFLARDHYYDGVTFHRVIPGFVAQAGDPQGTGRGGPGYTIPDEVNSNKFLDGTLGMAKTSAPNSGGSQFFIDYAPQPNLDGGYTAFGKVVVGREVLDKITPRDPATATQPGTKINTIVIEEK